MTRALCALAILASLAAADPLAELRKRWPSLDAAARITALADLERQPPEGALAQCRAWLSDPSGAVQTAAARVIAACGKDPDQRARAEAALGAHIDRRLEARARREAEEFEEVCRKFGRQVPPDDEISAGVDWRDPWDEQRRPLVPEAREERDSWRSLIDAVEKAGLRGLAPRVVRLFREHHDPEVLVRAVRLFEAWREWSALPDMADLARIQAEGREVGGSPVIGEEVYRALRLRWDVHRDRLWWSRPEYVPRVAGPIYRAASAVTGTTIDSTRELDRWIIEHETDLKARGIRLSPEFKARAKTR